MATSNLIGLLAEDGLTFAEAHAAINYDDEGKAVLAEYIRRGLGDTLMTEIGVRYAH